MSPTNRHLLALVAAAALCAAACYQSASGEHASLSVDATDPASVPSATPMLMLPAPVILSVDTPPPAASRPTEAPATPPPASATATTEPEPVDATPETPTPTPTASDLAQPTATATPDSAPPTEGPPPPVSATPFSDADLVAAIVARGLAYTPQAERPGCTGRAADVRHLYSSEGPPVTLWTYPTPDDLKADWALPSSGAPQHTIGGCEIDGGWIYWYENLVIAFEPQAEWIPETATREAIVAAFFSLTR